MKMELIASIVNSSSPTPLKWFKNLPYLKPKNQGPQIKIQVAKLKYFDMTPPEMMHVQGSRSTFIHLGRLELSLQTGDHRSMSS